MNTEPEQVPICEDNNLSDNLDDYTVKLKAQKVAIIRMLDKIKQDQDKSSIMDSIYQNESQIPNL